jgi:hypothetical protein
MPQKKSDNSDKSRGREQNGQGRVKDPEHDGRLRDNRERGVSKSTSR